jgi:hypothetical protein
MHRFFEEGDKVKVTLRFRGRELAHPELGMKLLQKVKADFEPVAKVRVRAPHGGPPDDHDPGAPVTGKPYGILGTVAVSAAVFASAAPAQNAATWSKPVAPFRIGEGLYYVGALDLTSYLFVTRAGLIVLDGGDGTVGKQVAANIRTLGFDPAQVKILLNTHQHFDHAAGLAEIRKAAPNAKLYASAADGPIIAAGGRATPS